MKTICKNLKELWRNKIIILFLSFIGIGLSTYAIEIIPPTFEYQLSVLGNTQDVTFFNRKDKPERVRISFRPFRQDSDEKYLGKWGTIYPKVITVPPKGQRTVKFAIEPPAGLAKGEYRALLFMEELEQKALNSEGKVVLKEGVTSSQVNMLINLGVVVYGYSGAKENLKVSGTVSNEKVKKDEIEFTLKNDGEITTKYILVYEGKRKDGSPKIEQREILVVEGYDEKISQDFPEGMSVQKIYLKDSKGNIIKNFK
ncbi:MULTISPECIES: hypothetical protein [Fusobacterium]|uniref:hypothetical protein n=1 Tax=Fusobacterium TaxID=848 RepID=UPI0015A4632B